MDAQAVNNMHRPQGMPFRCNKIGHVALYVKDLAALGQVLHRGDGV